MTKTQIKVRDINPLNQPVGVAITRIKKEQTGEIIVSQPQNQSVEALIMRAIDKGVSVETMEKLLAMRRELKAEFAQEEFNRAMANFQSECPTIKKTKAGGSTKSGVVAYYYAPIESIVEQVKNLIHKHGLSYSIKTQTLKDGVKSTCTVKHIAGHQESSDMEVPLGTKTDIMSAPQVVAAATTFSIRYAFCHAFGIMTGDDDTDANIKTDSKTVKPKPATYEESYEQIKQAIGAASSTKYLIDLDKSIAKSKFKPDHKKELSQLISQKVDILNTKK